jgi:AcrR family transcriptional regulator
MHARNKAQKPDHLSRILDAASELFLELGFERTSTADIARRAKVSKRELYTHFADKRAILSAAITGLQHSMGSEMDVEWGAAGDLRSVLLHAGTAIFNFIASKKFRNVFRSSRQSLSTIPWPPESSIFSDPAPAASRRQSFSSGT